MPPNPTTAAPKRTRGLHWGWAVVALTWAVALPGGHHLAQQAELQAVERRTETAVRTLRRDVEHLQAELAKLPADATTEPTRAALRALESTGAELGERLPDETAATAAELGHLSLIASVLALALVIITTIAVYRLDRRRVSQLGRARERVGHYRSMVDALQDGVVLLDEAQRVQAANPAARRMLSRHLAPMQQLGDWRPIGADGGVVAAADLPVTKVLHEGLAAHETVLAERCAAGPPDWLAARAVRLFDAETGRAGGVVLSLHDLSEHRRVEAALAESESTTLSLMNALADGVFVAQDFRFVFANSALPAMLGYAADEFVDVPFASVVAPPFLAVWNERFRQRVGAGAEPPRSYEVAFLSKDGARTIELELVATRAVYRGRAAVLGLVRDITDRKKVAAELALHRDHLEVLVESRTQQVLAAEAAQAEVERHGSSELRQAERRLGEANAELLQANEFVRTVADNIPGRVAYWDHEQRCRFVNRVYCDWYGKRREELIGRSIVEIFGNSRAVAHDDRIRLALLGQPQQFERDEVSVTGRRATTLLHYIPDLHGETVRGFFVVALDVTHTRETERSQQRLNEVLALVRDQAEAAERTKSAFLANMSHEIRTPLNAIVGLTHLMRRDVAEPALGTRLATVAHAAGSLLELVDGILDLSKMGAGQLVLEDIDFVLDAVLMRAFDLLVAEAGDKGLALVINTDHVPRRLRGDPHRLSQALVALLGNAIKFTTRGSVSLVATLLEDDGEAVLMRFEVSDTGPGLRPDQLRKLFTAFERAEVSGTRTEGGAGVGLAVSRHLAHLMGGETGVRSEFGIGSTFWLTARLHRSAEVGAPTRPVPLPSALPLGSDSPQASSLPPASPGPLAPGASAVPRPGPQATGALDLRSEQRLRADHAGARILLAEDDPVSQEVGRALLQHAGLVVDVASTGREAVRMAATASYALILMDMQMPEMDGIVAAGQLRTLAGTRDIPIIAMTANAYLEDRQACVAAGMNDFISKPVDPPALYETLARWLAARPVAA